MVGGDPWSQPYNYELFTETIATAAYNHFYPEGSATTPPPDPVPIPSPALPPDSDGESEDVSTAVHAGPAPPDLRDFVMVAHMYWSLLFAFVGGWVSLLMYWTAGAQCRSRQTSGRAG